VHYFRFDDSRRTTEYVQGITLALAPFLGVMGLEPAGEAPVSAILAGPIAGVRRQPLRPAQTPPDARRDGQDQFPDR
jgi:acetamidase/formamidase